MKHNLQNNKRSMNNKFILLLLLWIIIPTSSKAANYYWRATAANDLYTNLGNWETTPGSGLSPSIAPSISDNVFFPVTSNFTTINLNNGFCHTFKFTAPSAFIFTGTFTVGGSLFANGNATFSSIGVLTFSGSATDTINMGTAATRITGGSVIFENNTANGSYRFTNDITIASAVYMRTQSIYTGGKSFTCNQLRIEGTTVKTINFTGSKVSTTVGVAVYSSNLFDLDFMSPSTSTTYALTGTRFVCNTSNSAGIYQITPVANLNISFQSLTLNSPTSTLFLQQSSATYTMDSLIINTPTLTLGNSGFDNVVTGMTNTWNVGVIQLLKPAELIGGINTIMNVNKIVEPSSCLGQSFFYANSLDVFKLNNTSGSSFSTSTIAYRAVEFGGSPIVAAATDDKGFNASGTFTGSAATPNTFWWVGGVGNWNDPAEWSIISSGGTAQTSSGCLPTINSNVIFDANSFSAASQNVTIAGKSAYCRDITFTGTNRGNLIGLQLFVNGNADYTAARSITSSLYYIGSGNHTLTSGGLFTYTNSLNVFMGSGTYTLADNFLGDMTTTRINHNSGIFNTNGRTINVGEFSSRSFPSNTSNMRQLDITNSTLNIQRLNPSGGFQILNNSYLGVFTATGSHIKFGTNGRFLIGTHTVSNFLTPIVFNDISFLLPTGTAILYNGFSPGSAVVFNDINFAANADIYNGNNIPHTTNHFNLTSGFLYKFQQNCTFIITGGIVHTVSGCEDLVRISSMLSGTRAILRKTTASFDVNGAMIKDINANSTTLNVIGGVDLLNNNNVTLSAAVSRNMYWVNGTGNWSDGVGHWSIGTSGGNPAINNAGNCIPRAIDNVFFDANSFSTTAQTVTLDIDANCKNMLWDAAAGSDVPVLAGPPNRALNVFGTLELGAGMKSTFAGFINMQGNNTAANSQSMRFNSVTITNGIYMIGGGRYDLLDSLKMTEAIIFTANNFLYLQNGVFQSNGNYITAPALWIVAQSGSGANISNSTIILTSRKVLLSSGGDSYYATHNSTGIWNAAGSSITSHSEKIVIINNSAIAPVYGNITMNATIVPTYLGNPNNANPITFKRVKWLAAPSAGSLMHGNLTMDSLIYINSSINRIWAGRTITINDSLIAYGTPCVPIEIKSATPGSQATMRAVRCNFDINFGALTDIVANGCTPAQNKVLGNNSGGNSNWTFTSIPALTKLGPAVAIPCNKFPYTQSTIGFGNIPDMSYLWNTGATTPQLDIATPGTYSIVVTYAAGCTVNGSRTISNAGIPPIAIATGVEQISPSNCTANNYTYYEGATASSTKDFSILAINKNGNTITPSSVTVNNQGNLTGGAGTFTNSAPNYYQSTDGTNTIRVSKRLHSVVAPGSFTTNGGVIARVYYIPSEHLTLSSDAWPSGVTTSYTGWFKYYNHTAQNVVNDMTPTLLTNAEPITPTASGVENGVNYVEFTVTSFSTFGYITSTVLMPLPIKLISFKTTTENCQNKLEWVTAEELNLSHFEIEKSIDGKSFFKLGKVNAKGGNGLNVYQFKDVSVSSNNAYYRLKIIDNNTKSEYSNTILGRNCNATENAVLVYPNPAQKEINVIITESGNYNLILYNALGQIVWQMEKEISNNQEAITIQRNNLPNGIYMLQLKNVDNNTLHTIKLQMQ